MFTFPGPISMQQRKETKTIFFEQNQDADRSRNDHFLNFFFS